MFASGNDGGVHVTGAASVTDTNGQYVNNSNPGLWMVDVDGAVSLSGSTVTGNDADGVLLSDIGGAITVTNVTAEDNTLAGLALYGPGTMTVGAFT